MTIAEMLDPSGMGRRTGESQEDYFKRIKATHDSPEYVKGREAQRVAERSAINTGLFGIPEIIAKAADSDAYKKYQEVKERNKAADIAGSVVGAFAPTGGLLAKGLGAGAKAIGAGKLASGLGKAGQIIQSGGQIGNKGKIVSGAIRGGLSAAEQLAPRLVTGNVSKQDAAKELALGGGLGGLAGGVSAGIERIPEAMKSLSKWGNKTILKNADVSNRILRGAEKYAGDDPAKYVKELSDYAIQNQLHREPKLDALVKQTKDTWKTIANKFDEIGVSLVDDIKGITSRPGIKNVISRNPAAITEVADIVGKVDATDNFAGKRKFLQDILYDQKTPTETKNIVRDVLADLEEKAEHLSGLDMGKAKHEWKMMKPFELADIRDDLSVTGAGLARGSDTIAKAAIGAALGGGTTGFSKNEDGSYNWGNLISGVLGGAAVGALNKQLSYQAAKLATKLDPDVIANLIKGKQFDKIAELAQKMDATDVVKPASKFMQGIDSPPVDEVQAETIPDEYKAPQADELLTSGQPTPEAVEAPVKPAINEKLMAKIDKKLMQIYAEKYSDAISWEDFHDKVEKLTDGFEPVKAGKILFTDPKQRAKFTRDYKAAQKLKGYSEAYAPEPGLMASIENFGKGGKSKAQKAFDQKEIADTIGSLLAKEGSTPTDNDMERIQNDLKTIGALKVSPEEKQNILLQKLQDFYGLDVESLRVLGLV